MYEQGFSIETDSDELGSVQSVSEYLRINYPNVHVVLSGKLGSKKEKRSPIPPATIIIFARDGGIGFVIAPKDHPKNAHGFIEEGGELLTQIEEALAANRVGWKPSKRK